MKVTNFYYQTALVFGSENYVGRGEGPMPLNWVTNSNVAQIIHIVGVVVLQWQHSASYCVESGCLAKAKPVLETHITILAAGPSNTLSYAFNVGREDCLSTTLSPSITARREGEGSDLLNHFVVSRQG